MRNATIEILDELRETKGLQSDYKLAKLLDVRQQTVSNYRNNRTQMTDEIAYRAARMLGRPPGPILARLAGERAKDTHVAKVWFEMARQIAKPAR
jgi:transcriptional regulator with XRE-family HTH domain